MVEPVSTFFALKAGLGLAGKIALKYHYVAKMAGLKAWLAQYVGAQAAGVSVAVLASACTAIYWEKSVKGNSDDDAIAAAVGKGVSWDIARAIFRWLYAP